MKVALSVKNNMITEHFGHCDYFVIYNISKGNIKSSTIVKNPPHEKGYLPKFLKENDVNVVIAGGMGKMAADFLTELDIKCYMNVTGDVQGAIEDFINGNLEHNQKPCSEKNH